MQYSLVQAQDMKIQCSLNNKEGHEEKKINGKIFGQSTNKKKTHTVTSATVEVDNHISSINTSSPTVCTNSSLRVAFLSNRWQYL